MMKIRSRGERLRTRSRVLCLAVVLVSACVPASEPLPTVQRPVPAPPPPLPVAEPAADPVPPEIAREFRGVWVASIGNMDWPSRPGLSTERQRAELLAILDRASHLGLNAVLLQVRPAADALYPSPHEPWSEYLTGEMGRAPEPLYDPLQLAVEEAHRRGLELHAWFNPYRARHPSAKSAASADHITRARPGLVRRYGTQLWMDPSEPAVQDHSVRVILDVVRRYDIDGVHIDDYFYPYREYNARGKLIQFPDSANYARYLAQGGRLGRSDWRRQNVDRFVERLYGEIKREKPRVKFGISPFGIWRPGHPAQIRGLDAYEEIFADARKWLANGWLDYFVPQLYWPIAQREQSFPVLLDWWVEQNRARRHIWPGHFTSRVRERRWPASEILDQIRVTREHPGATGTVHFNMSTLMRSPDGLAERLARESYAEPALVPASPWLHSALPGRPQLSLQGCTPAGTVIGLAPGDAEEVFLWTVRARTGSRWSSRVVPGREREVAVPDAPDQIVVGAVGRTGNEGPAVTLRARCPARPIEVSAPPPLMARRGRRR